MQHRTKSHQRHNQSIGYDTFVRLAIIIFILTLTVQAKAQWEIEDSHTTASLRGIDSVGDGVAWASGTNGTVLRTQDNGSHWQACAIPPGAEKLDFRGVQAFDANTAIVMSSGKGNLSRLYKTTNGCRTWKLIFTNPDKEGFWDAIQFTDKRHGFLLGDPILVAGSTKKRVVFKQTIDGAKTWISWERKVSDFAIGDDASAFAASNSSMIAQDRFHAVVATGGKGGSAIGFPGNNEFCTLPCPCLCPPVSERKAMRDLNIWWKLAAPFPQTETGGIFSIAKHEERIVAVGGDYKLPDSPVQTAAYGNDWLGGGFQTAQTPPHGYRSAVAYDAQQKLWITVGPNGSDISRDDGRNWTALKPTKEDAADADKNWNALSLPFVVGPNGRIGKLRPSALQP
jgi:photosystem II stability/assembly factor-like uncharacterized protein